MIDSMFVITEDGNVLIEKHWRGHQPRAEVCDFFLDTVAKHGSQELCPVLDTPKGYLVHLYRYKMYFLAAMKAEAPPLVSVEFMQVREQQLTPSHPRSKRRITRCLCWGAARGRGAL